VGWFSKNRSDADVGDKRSVEEGLWRRCDECGEMRLAEEFVKNLEVCPACGYHYRLPTEAWLELVTDLGTFEEIDAGLVAADPLEFKDQKRYRDRSRATRAATGVSEAIQTGTARVDGMGIGIGIFVFRFMGGSMGSVVGEKITRMYEVCLERRIPAIVMNASGGARMQEGIFSLMQMAKTCAARARLRDAGIPYVSILLNPTTGGVAASFALLGDVILAEPRALIGFAGPRVIEQTIRQKLPEGFQRSEFLLQHGFVDRIVERSEMKSVLARVLKHLAPR
jgi:acetyl-CoA carboxylase carboxyl transferase subunit beta